MTKRVSYSSSRRKIAGKKAKKNGESAEKLFLDNNKAWEAEGKASFIRLTPGVKHVRSSSGKLNQISDKIKHCDTIGNVGVYSVRLEIKSSENRRWYPSYTSDSFKKEFMSLKVGSLCGCYSAFLILERTANELLIDQWYLAEIQPQSVKVPAREQWIALKIENLPETILGRIGNGVV